MYRAFQERMATSPALPSAKVSPHQTAQIDAMLSTTWFQLRSNPTTMTHTSCGTRPGDSIADMLYTFIMARFLHVLRERFIDAGLRSTFDLKWVPQAQLSPDEREPQHIIQACWVDDLVLLLRAGSPSVLIQKVKAAIAITQDLSAEFGLKLNYGPDKTAVLLALRGSTANQVRLQLLAGNPANPSLEFGCESLSTPGLLSVVATYVYLGQVQDQKGHPAAEVHRRFHVIQASSRLLRRNIFRSPRMPYRTKAMLHQSLVMSKLLYGAGSWQEPHLKTQQSWTTQLVQVYSHIAPNVKRGPGIYSIDILADCKVSHPMLTLACARFHLYDRVMQTELTELLALLQAQDPAHSWFSLIFQDLQRLSEQCPGHPVFNIAHQGTEEEMAQYCAHHPKALTRLGKWAQKLYIATLNIWKQFRAFQAHLESEASKFNAQWHQLTPAAEPAGNFACPQCAATFSSFTAMCTLSFKKHGVHNIVHQYTASNVCRGCLKVYDSRQQVLTHLKYLKTGCLTKLIATVEPYADEDMRAILQEQRDLIAAQKRTDRTKRHRFPVCQGIGPKLPWPWQRHPCLNNHDTRDKPLQLQDIPSEWYDEVVAATATANTETIYQTLDMWPYHGSVAAQIISNFELALDLPYQDKLNCYLALIAAIQLWQETNLVEPQRRSMHVSTSDVQSRVQTIRAVAVGNHDSSIPVQFRRHVGTDKLWNDFTVTMQLRLQLTKENNRQYTFQAPVPRPLPQVPIYLYVYSGSSWRLPESS